MNYSISRSISRKSHSKISFHSSTTNGSISALSSHENPRDFLWDFNWYSVLLIGIGCLFIIVLIVAGLWYRFHRRHSPINDFLETIQIEEKRLSSSSNKAPPVPPRPTAYTTILGKVEYRSNL